MERGRTEIGRGIFGAEPLEAGKVVLEGETLQIHCPQDAIRQGIGYMSEDRKEQGLYVKFDIRQNLIANQLRHFSKRGFLREKQVDQMVQDAVKDFRISTPGIRQLVNKLSGGNQQKVLLAAWFGRSRPRVLIVDEPTRGVDVGAKSEIYNLLRNLAETGVGIIMISSDLPEILGVSDRIMVIREGRNVGIIPASEATEEKVIALASGVTKGDCVSTE